MRQESSHECLISSETNEVKEATSYPEIAWVFIRNDKMWILSERFPQSVVSQIDPQLIDSRCAENIKFEITAESQNEGSLLFECLSLKIPETLVLSPSP